MPSPIPPAFFFCSPNSVDNSVEILSYGGLLHPMGLVDAMLHGIFPWTIESREKLPHPEAFHNVEDAQADLEPEWSIKNFKLSKEETEAQWRIIGLLKLSQDASDQATGGEYDYDASNRIYKSLPPRLREASWRGVSYEDLPTLEENGELLAWFSPRRRGILDLSNVHVPRRLQRIARSGQFVVTFDQAFPEVVLACASADERLKTGTWITREFYAAYCKMHELGVAHSAECWRVNAETNKRTLVGGVYGLAINGFFEGESMFSAESNGSKIALFTLLAHLTERGFKLFDLQVLNDHTKSLGGVTIPRDEYLRRLEEALLTPVSF